MVFINYILIKNLIKDIFWEILYYISDIILIIIVFWFYRIILLMSSRLKQIGVKCVRLTYENSQ